VGKCLCMDNEVGRCLYEQVDRWATKSRETELKSANKEFGKQRVHAVLNMKRILNLQRTTLIGHF
jgi:hypothetical protein